MKKLLGLILFIGLTYTSQAQQISDNAIGIRLGGFNSVEATYQRKLGEKNRLELDLAVGSSYNVRTLQLTGLYQWVWNINGGFNWYAGVGGGVGHTAYVDTYNYGYSQTTGPGKTFLFAAGDIGIEYHFDFPLMLSLDLRPQVESVNYHNDIVGNRNYFDNFIGLSARYKF